MLGSFNYSGLGKAYFCLPKGMEPHKMWSKTLPSRGTCKCKGPEVNMSLAETQQEGSGGKLE